MFFIKKASVFLVVLVEYSWQVEQMLMSGVGMRVVIINMNT